MRAGVVVKGQEGTSCAIMVVLGQENDPSFFSSISVLLMPFVAVMVELKSELAWKFLKQLEYLALYIASLQAIELC